MKKNFLMAGIALLAVACSDNDDKKTTTEYTIPVEFNTTVPWEWAYISLDDGVLVSENGEWDIAVLKYMLAEMAIKTPSDAEMRGGLKYMKGRSLSDTTIVWSGEKAVSMAVREDGMFVMPPQYVALPSRTFGKYQVKFYYDGQEFKVEVRE